MGLEQIDFDCHTICAVPCPHYIATSLFAVAYLLLHESSQLLSLPPRQNFDQAGTCKIDFCVFTYV
jgi:hypothetical protein